MKWLAAAAIVLFAAFFVVLILNSNRVARDCAAKGGVLIKSYEGLTCIEARRL